MYPYEDRCQSLACKMELQNKDLWKKFHGHQLEMIITKSGRRMFPTLRVQLSDLEPHALYCIFLEMVPASTCRYKYRPSGGWTPGGPEDSQSPQRIYMHPESPATGEHWMSQAVSFGLLKLTNTAAAPPGQVVLTSMHKYQPKIMVFKTADPRMVSWAPSAVAAFEETQFIAVTAYQNEKITKLKIENNPYAKGFRENGRSVISKRKRNDLDEKEKDSNSDEISVKRLRSFTPKSDSEHGSGVSSTSTPLCSPIPEDSTPQNRSLSPHYPPMIHGSAFDTYMTYRYPVSFEPSYYYSQPHFNYYNPANLYTSNPVYHSPFLSARSYNFPDKTNVEKPKKPTDFSISAIMGYGDVSFV